MAKRLYPIARVKLDGKGRRAWAKYDGFGQEDLVADLMRQGRVAVAPADYAALGIPPPGKAGLRAPSAMLVEHPKLNCVVARPCLDTSQPLGLGHFTTYGGAWVALPNHGLQGETQLFQYEGHANAATGALSNFTLPPDPIFAVSLYRADPPEDFDWSQASPYTEIHFGITATDDWTLCFPYGAPMFLVRRIGGAWWKVPNTERSVRVPSLEGFSSGQRLLLWVAVWRGKIVLSTDGFAEDVWVYESPEGPIRVGGGKVALWHNAGQFMFSFFPIAMPTAVLDSLPLETGYYTQDSTGQVFVYARQQPVLSSGGAPLAAVQVTDTTALREDLTNTQRAWRAVIAPYVWHQWGVGTDPDTGQKVDFHTCASPQLFSVAIGQYAQVEEMDPPPVTDLSADVKRLEGSHSDRLPTVRYRLEVDNQLGQHLDLGEYQRLTVELGWKHDDESETYVPTAEGYVVEPPPEVAGGGEAGLEVAMLDGCLRLRDEKADGRTPAFDGWPIKEVFQWVLDRCGIPRAQQNLEDTGLRLSLGEPEESLWLPEPGRGWLEFLEEVARFDYGAALFVDEQGRFTKACPYCRAWRTAEDVTRHDGTLTGACVSEVRWHLYTRPSEAPDPEEPGEVLELAKPRLSLSERDFVNYVAVCGVGRNGQPIRSVFYDPASLYDPQSDRFVGWRKMEVAALRGYTTQAETNRLAQELFAQRSGRPEYITLLTPLEPEMRIGEVLEVHGGEQVGASGQKYRIVALGHRVERSPQRTAVTWVKAKWLGTAG